MFNAVKTGILLCAALTFCQAQIKAVSSEQAKAEGVNWKTRTITAVGIGAPNLDAPQAAQRPDGIVVVTGKEKVGQNRCIQDAC